MREEQDGGSELERQLPQQLWTMDQLFLCKKAEMRIGIWNIIFKILQQTIHKILNSLPSKQNIPVVQSKCSLRHEEMILLWGMRIKSLLGNQAFSFLFPQT